MMPGGTPPEDLPRLLAYRRAHGLAADLLEQAGMERAGYGAADPARARGATPGRADRR